MTAAPAIAMPALAPAQWRTLGGGIRPPERARGLDSVWRRALGAAARLRARPRTFLARAARIAEMEREVRGLADAALDAELARGRAIVRAGRESEADADRAFALVREAARRTLGLTPYVEQIAAALAIHAGCVAELATGEGKTLAAVMPAAISGWRGRGCHVITANDYLARRDAQWMAPLYARCGVRAAWLTQETPADERRRAWAADVAYATSREAAADFLRDRLRLRAAGARGPGVILAARDGRIDPALLVMRGLEHAIVDEADAILIDDAVTPLIISGPPAPGANPDQAEAYRAARDLAAPLTEGTHYRADRAARDIELTRAGHDAIDAAAEARGISTLPAALAGPRRREELVVQALAAREFFQAGRHYIIDAGRAVIVDDSTGRLTPDRTWRDGLHQAIEARENLDIRADQETLARISFQRFFRLYRRLAGMTGTAREDAAELWQVYGLTVVPIPTHRPCRRVVRPPKVYATARARRDAVVDQVRDAHRAGRPVLIGVRSVAQTDELSAHLRHAGLPHDVLNATRHAEEAAIIARAGEPGRITLATNMAGRGTDIALGPGVAEHGGLLVISAESNESARIERQLFGRCARQGDPGEATAFASLDDETLRRGLAPALRALLRLLAPGEAPAPPKSRAGTATLPRPLAAAALRLARRSLARAAVLNRRAVLEADDWLDESLAFAASDA